MPNYCISQKEKIGQSITC